MKERLSLFFSAMAIFLLLPCVLTFLISGPQTCSLNGKIDIEKCLPAIIQMQLPGEYGTEMKKAQAVVLRSNMKKQLEDGQDMCSLILAYFKSRSEKAARPLIDKEYARCRTAADKTCCEVLTYGGKSVMAPYHVISAGRTRNGSQVLQDASWDYLKSVESESDSKGRLFAETVEIPLNALPGELEIIRRDDSGYVLELQADGRILSGEYFRIAMGLPSGCFSIEKTEKFMRFFCKGKGHGLGLSQYGGGEMEKEGKDYQEILQYYFPALTLEKSI